MEDLNNLKKGFESLREELDKLKKQLPFKEWEMRRVKRSEIQVVTNAGNNSIWRVNFTKQFSEPPIIVPIPYTNAGIKAYWSCQNPTTTSFDLAASYRQSNEHEIHYLAFVPNKETV